MLRQSWFDPRPFLAAGCLAIGLLSVASAQSWELTEANIDRAIRDAEPNLLTDRFRPAIHLTPPAGCMGDPNGGIFHNGWYHIFYGQNPFAHHPGGWYWAHARSRDLVSWQMMPNRLTPPADLGLDAIGSGSTLVTEAGQRLAFYSQSRGEAMEFWRAEFNDDDLSAWKHPGKNPVLTLDHPGLPPFDGFWRDPFVFTAGGRTFLIACADLFDEDYVPVPIFEAEDAELTDWQYRGNLFTVPKHRYRNLEVPEFRPIGDKWLFMASTDAPVDRVNYFVGDFDSETLRFTPELSGPIDHSGHYYAQETIVDDQGRVFLMGWLPGWDRPWLPTYMNAPLKNANQTWNGCFALPRRLTLEKGGLRQRPVESLRQLRGEALRYGGRELPVDGPGTAIEVLSEVRGDPLEIELALDLNAAAFCGLNVLSGPDGVGGLAIIWSGDVLNVDGVSVPLPDWQPGQPIKLRVFVDKKFVEVFVNDGQACVSRQVDEQFVRGDRVALTSLGGTGKLVSLTAWKLKAAE